MGRKTISVSEIKKYLNDILKEDNVDQGIKNGICSCMEIILHMSNNYNGFQYNIVDESGRPLEGTTYCRTYF